MCAVLLHCSFACIYRTLLSATQSYITLAAFPKRLMSFSSCQYTWISTICSCIAYTLTVYVYMNVYAWHVWKTLWFYPFTPHTHFLRFFLQFKSAKQLLVQCTHKYVFIYIYRQSHCRRAQKYAYSKLSLTSIVYFCSRKCKPGTPTTVFTYIYVCMYFRIRFDLHLFCRFKV